jgi:hypothetical protein
MRVQKFCTRMSKPRAILKLEIAFFHLLATGHGANPALEYRYGVIPLVPAP